MKLNLTFSESKTKISRDDSQKPPLGALLPAGQDSSLKNVTSSLSALLGIVDEVLPPGFQIFNGSVIYGWTGTSWEDADTGEPVTDAALSGEVTFRNPASYDIGITW